MVIFQANTLINFYFEVCPQDDNNLRRDADHKNKPKVFGFKGQVHGQQNAPHKRSDNDKIYFAFAPNGVKHQQNDTGNRAASSFSLWSGSKR